MCVRQKGRLVKHAHTQAMTPLKAFVGCASAKELDEKTRAFSHSLIYLPLRFYLPL
jgi:hypothetical protein